MMGETSNAVPYRNLGPIPWIVRVATRPAALGLGPGKTALFLSFPYVRPEPVLVK
eukprot:COSAG06_NODE_3132_length_5805_cov_85.931300_5_plen_55_part_00